MTMVALPVIDPVYVEWKKFLQTGNPYKCKARQQVAESWGRCYQRGIDPYSDTICHRLDDLNLHKVLKEKEVLIEIAKPFLAKLHGLFQRAGYVVALADENGCILEMLCDEDTRQQPVARFFYPGVSWREEAAGTNAIGTALMLGEALQISGAEHYCRKYHAFTCSAAIVFDSNGRRTGVLAMACASHLPMLEFVDVIAEAVTGQLNIWQKKRELVLIHKKMANFLNTVSDGVFVVDMREVVIEINPAGQAMLGKAGPQQIVGTELTRLFDSKTGALLTASHCYRDVEIKMDTLGGGGHCLASREPVFNEQDVITGGIIFIRYSKQIKNTINRHSGNSATFEFRDIIGTSDQLCKAIHVATRAAATNANVLLNGESGTGKELFAQGIHNGSDRRNGPFVAVNCGAIPRELIGSELFGYEEGAFTGAKRGGKPGKFELASGGTLFLDEIGDMPLEQQITLLRVLQERKVTRIGSDKMIPVNIRLICATHRDLLEEVNYGTFRLDLYYRLNVLSIVIPPLRERREDIQQLAEHFLTKVRCEQGLALSLAPEAIAYLNEYYWPGNVRELQNVIEHAACIAESGVITAENLSEKLHAASSPAEPQLEQAGEIIFIREQRQNMARIIEKNKIISKLNAFAGNVSKVAKELGISRNTLYNKMRMYAIKN